MRGRTNIIGTNNITPGAASPNSTLLTDATSTTGLLITQSATAPSTQVPLRVVASDNSTLFEIRNDGHVATYGMKIGVDYPLLTNAVCLNGQQNPPCLELTDGTGIGARIWSGTGAPSVSTVGTARVGDWYLRRDTPSTVNQRIYICTVAGTPGTWTVIA